MGPDIISEDCLIMSKLSKLRLGQAGSIAFDAVVPVSRCLLPVLLLLPPTAAASAALLLTSALADLSCD